MIKILIIEQNVGPEHVFACISGTPYPVGVPLILVHSLHQPLFLGTFFNQI